MPNLLHTLFIECCFALANCPQLTLKAQRRALCREHQLADKVILVKKMIPLNEVERTPLNLLPGEKVVNAHDVILQTTPDGDRNGKGVGFRILVRLYQGEVRSQEREIPLHE